MTCKDHRQQTTVQGPPGARWEEILLAEHPDGAGDTLWVGDTGLEREQEVGGED